MKFLTFFSNLMIPFLLFYIIGSGLLARRNLYEDFLEGAKEGLKTAVGICPALVGLMTAVGILRASGLLDFTGRVLGKITAPAGLPAELLPLTVIRLFSSSAAVGLLLDIFKEFGADSAAGLMGALVLGSTESVFYCMSIYFSAVKVEKTRYTLAGALIASLAGVAAAVFLVNRVIYGQ